MIRSFLKKAVKKAIGREEKAPVEAPRQPVAKINPIPGPPPPGNSDEEPEEEVRLEIEGPEISTKILDGESFVFIDIREPGEVSAGYVQGARLIPMNQVPQRLTEIPKDENVVIYCAAGGRSYGVTQYLRDQGYDTVWSLVEGMHGWLEHGGKLVQPTGKARFPITSRVRITRDPLEVDGAVVPEEGRTGTVQAATQVDDAVVYTIGLVDSDGVPYVIDGIAESELARPTPGK